MRKKSVIIPLLLIVYLAVMSYIGYPAYVRGTFSALYYFGSIGATLLVILLLHLSLRQREKLRNQREKNQ